MASDGLVVRLDGVDELRRALDEAAATIRKKAVRGALRKAGQVISRSAKQAAPVLRMPTKTRKPGTVKRAISLRNSKFARQAGDEGVFVSVRPLRGSRQKKLGRAGANNPNDPFYWRFLEFGTKKMGKRPFLGPSAESQGQAAIDTFMREVVPQIERINQRASRVR